MRMRGKILTLTSGAMAGQALAILSLPLITRLYTPDQLGMFQVMLAFCNMLGVIGALCFERALLLKIGPVHVAVLGRLCLWVIVGMTLLSVPLYLGFAHLVPAAPLWIAGAPVVGIVAALTLSRGLFLLRYTQTLAEGNMRRASLAVFLKDLARILARIGLGLSALNPIGLFVAAVVDWTSGLFLVKPQDPKPHAHLPRFPLRALWRRYRQYPMFYAPAAALTTLVAQMPLLLLSSLYSAREAGLYALAFLLLDRPGRILAKAGGDILMQRMAHAKAAQARRNVLHKTALLSSLTFLALLIIAGLTWALAGPLLGRDWVTTGLLAFACLPHVLALFLSDLSIGLFAARAQSKTGLLRQILAAVILVISFALAHGLGLPVVQTVLVAGLAHCALQITVLALFYRGLTSEAHP